MKINPQQARFISALACGLGGDPAKALNTLQKIDSLPKLGMLRIPGKEASENNEVIEAIGEDVLGPSLSAYKYSAGSSVVLVMMLQDEDLTRKSSSVTNQLRDWVDQITDGKGGTTFERELNKE